MAIWITKERATPGPVFGSIDRFEGLGIFIDTYKNARPGVVFPYVMAMLGNSSTTYDKDHDGKANELAGCSVDLVSPGPGYVTNDVHCLGARSSTSIDSNKDAAHVFSRAIVERRAAISSC